jgi:hypothetical protein
MTFLGMQPTSVAAARDHLRDVQEGVHATRLDIDAALRAVRWIGDDADRFRDTAHADLGGQLLHLGVLLTAVEARMTTALAQQLRVSGEL